MPSGIKKELSNHIILQIINEYKEGNSLRMISKKYGFKCHKSILKILKNNNINTRSLKERITKFSIDEINKIISLYKDPAITITEIAKQLKYDSKTIKKELKRLNLYDKDKYDKYLISKFDVIDTEEKAYWIGFLAADASISNNQLSLRLAEKDKDHLLKFKKYIGIDYKISKIKAKLNNKIFVGYEYRISSIKFIKSLIKHNLIAKKSCNLIVPKTIPKNLIRHYIRGIIDGDGCYSISNNKMNFSLISSINVCEEIQNILINKCNLSKTKLQIKNYNIGKMAYLRYSGNKQILKIVNYLYDNSQIYLDRKRKLLQDFYAPSAEFKVVNVAGNTLVAAVNVVPDL